MKADLGRLDRALRKAVRAGLGRCGAVEADHAHEGHVVVHEGHEALVEVVLEVCDVVLLRVQCGELLESPSAPVPVPAGAACLSLFVARSELDASRGGEAAQPRRRAPGRSRLSGRCGRAQVSEHRLEPRRGLGHPSPEAHEALDAAPVFRRENLRERAGVGARRLQQRAYLPKALTPQSRRPV